MYKVISKTHIQQMPEIEKEFREAMDKEVEERFPQFTITSQEAEWREGAEWAFNFLINNKSIK